MAQASAAVTEIGHNNPPEPTLLERLSEEHAQLRHEIETLADKANSAPRKITGADDLDKVGVIVKAARALSKSVGAAHKNEKDLYLVGGRIVDTFFKTLDERLDRISTAFQGVADDYQRAVAAEARRKAEEEARKAREEEARRLELARKAAEANRGAHAEQHAAKADVAAAAAEHAEEAAQASAADLVRTRTESGILATAKTEWAVEVVDYTAIPLDMLRMCFKREHIEQAIRLAVKNGVREMKGCRIFQEIKANFR